MSHSQHCISSSSGTKAPRRENGRLPSGCRTIQVIVPEDVHFHVQAQASLSRMEPMDYVYRLLREAKPFDVSGLPVTGAN
jgi:hypothetical protein